jgi:hypothetical protein
MQLLAQRCIEKAGYEWPVVTDELTAGPGESWNAAGRKLFTVRLAEKYGYGNSDMSDLSLDAQRRVRATSEADEATARKSPDITAPCLEKAQRKLGLHVKTEDEPHFFAAKLGFAAADDARKDRSVKAANQRWRKCMSGVGLPDLPDDPNEMPSPSISKLRPAVDNVVPIGEETNVPAEERRVAIADAKCQESSGWASAEYNAEWAAEAKAVAAHADELERYAAKAEALDKWTEAVIASFAPSAE